LLATGLFLYLASLSRIGAQNTGSITQYYATDPLQLLFGKFRDWDNIRVIHFIIFATALAAVVAIYIQVLGARSRKRRKLISKIPNTEWIQQEFAETLRTIQAYIETEEETKYVQRKILLPESQGDGNKGWSKWPERNLKLSLENKTLEHINFGRIVSESYLLIERLVVRRLPYLKASRDRTVRDYMLKVAKEFQIEDIDIATYLALYEEARFGGGRKIQNIHADSPYRSKKNTRDIKARRRSSIVIRETMDIIDADRFAIFLRTLLRIMEKIRVGYRAQAKTVGQSSSRMGSAKVHRRASSDQLARISARSSNRDLPQALMSRAKFHDA